MRTPASLLAPDAEFQHRPPTCRLDEVGISCGTDLSSLVRDHLRSWERFLMPLREVSFDLLEIGVGAGASLRTWREWFPAARLVGLDVRRVFIDPPIDNCTLVHGSQADPTVLMRLVRDYRFRLIVDDGSRHADDKLQTFLTLFPWLESDSVYLCSGIDSLDASAADASASAALQPVELGGAATPAWFANLGISLSTSRAPGHPRSAWPAIARVQAHATGVTLLRGSAVVTT
jgi:hypothetical protein